MTTRTHAQEQRVVEAMLRLYCQHHHRPQQGDRLCAHCQALLEYAQQRLEHCRWGERKPTCRQCPVHCYRPDRRSQMREVMRWAGPRMLLHHPVMALAHMLREWGRG